MSTSTITLNIPSHLAELEIGRRAANKVARHEAAKANVSHTPISLPDALGAAGITLTPAEAQLLLTRTSVELAEAAAGAVARSVAPKLHVVASTKGAKPTPKPRATGVGSRGGDPRKALARLQSADSGPVFSPANRAAYKAAYAKAQTLSIPQVHKALVKLGVKVAQ